MPHGGESAGFVQTLDGLTSMLSDERGDVEERSVAGLFFEDTRFLNRLLLTVGGERTMLLTSHQVEYYAAAFYLTNPELDGLLAQSLTIARHRFVGNGLHEELAVENHLNEPVEIELRLSCGADFASVFEVEEDSFRKVGKWRTGHDTERGTIGFEYEHERFQAASRIESSEPARIEEQGIAGRLATELVSRLVLPSADLVFDLRLEPHGSWRTTIRLEVERNGERFEPRRERYGDRHRPRERMREKWEEEPPELEAAWPPLERAYRRALVDLTALRFRARVDGHELFLPAGGMPWYLSVLGRDALLIAYQALPFAPELARETLVSLAELQGSELDDFHDQEPGRILHELRLGRLTAIGEKPYAPYYGSVDSTELWLILLSEHRRFTGDPELCRRLEPNARAALAWIDEYGDRDGDGFVEYETRSSEGLRNQCWKDSDDSVRFADGTIAEPPIAICEAQGYVYDAKLRIAQIAEEVWDDAELAARLRSEASALRDRFEEAFWIDERGGYYAEGLDRDKRCVDSITSNIGHLLWSGIVPEEQAAAVAAQLRREAMFSGWGVRTMSAEEAAYNPISYHNGSVWPHDNALIAAGLARYGFREDAGRIVVALLEAAQHLDHHDRLPELFAGYPRAQTRFPVWYPKAASPLGWASAAPLLLLRALLGLDADEGQPRIDPALPDEVGRIVLRGVHAGGRQLTVVADGDDGDLRTEAS